MKKIFSNYLDDIFFSAGIALFTIGFIQAAPKIAVIFIGLILVIGGIWIGFVRSQSPP
jgi:flagellar biosynthesis component FlhA